MKYKLIVIGAGALLLAVGLHATPALAGQQVRHGNSAVTFTLPLRTWAKAYVILGMQTGKYVPRTHFSIPLLWIYDPAGHPVVFYTKPDAVKLASVLEKFPESLEHAPTLKGEPNFSSMSAVLRKAGAKPLEQPQGKRYTAVFYAYATKQGLCAGCTKFAQLLQAAAKRHPGEWRIVTVKLTKN